MSIYVKKKYSVTWVLDTVFYIYLSWILLFFPLETANPMGLELLIPDCYENQEVVPHKNYFGGHEGDGEYIWYRTKEKLHGSALTEISYAGEEVIACSRTL